MTGFLKNKKIIMVICAVLVVSLALVALVSTIVGVSLSNNFRMGKVSKIELGMRMSDVEKILGDPSEESEEGFTLYWYQGKVERKLNKAENILEKAFESEDEDKIEEYLEKYDKLMAELEEMTFKSIAVSFDGDGKVSEVFYNKQSKYLGEMDSYEKEVKKSVLKVGAVSGTLVTIDGEKTFNISSEESELAYNVKYQDGSYYLGTISAYDIDLNKEDGSYYAVWEDALGEYCAKKLARLKYEYVIENEVLTFYETSEEEITIPSGVKTILTDAIKPNTTIKSIVIPSYVENIGASAFAGTTNLASVTIDNDIVEISENAFASNRQLQTVHFNGNKAEFKALNVKAGNDSFKNANVIYNCDPGTHTDGEVKTEKYITVSCTENASHDEVTYCADCKKEINRNTIVTEPAKGHTPKSPVEENRIEATCTENGSYDEVAYCRACNEEIARENIIIAAGHKEQTIPAVSPTCTETGLTNGIKCSVCEEILKAQEIVEAKGHTPGDPVAENMQDSINCQTTGSADKVVRCTLCEEEISRESITLIGNHNYSNGVCTICQNKQETYTRNENYIYFGEYPQSIKNSSVIITTRTNEKGYYLGSDGEWYAKVTATPYGSSYTFSTGTTVTSGTVYYFKVEPIRWRILSTDGNTALILCDSIIANHRYYYGSNNYAESEIRQWLNEQFYETAFSELQREIILTTTVDNSAASTGYTSNPYACEDTEDKVFLLSYKEVTSSSYGFSTSTSSSATREMLTSDYSRATGAYMYTSSSRLGNGYWWLRSPYFGIRNCARFVDFDGHITYYYNYVYDTSNGVVPALQIQL